LAGRGIEESQLDKGAFVSWSENEQTAKKPLFF
jgi:hypothetical protein